MVHVGKGWEAARGGVGVGGRVGREGGKPQGWHASVGGSGEKVGNCRDGVFQQRWEAAGGFCVSAGGSGRVKPWGWHMERRVGGEMWGDATGVGVGG